ncbi:XK-related protein 6-like isoform X2 [Lineus longissimus]|uniref:XK-related protein 6-like isoform X2 n=1 Tax=Lineus longissimus TaxID=88925 RepID=UPI00315CF223
MALEKAALGSFLVKRNRTRPPFPAAKTRSGGLDQPDSAGPSATDDDDGERQGCDWSLATLLQIVSYLVFAVLYIIDCGSDIWTASVYKTDQEDRHFWLTFIIVAVSSVTLVVINLYWYYCEYEDDKAVRPDGMPPRWVWAVRIIFTLCLLGPFLRCIEICRLGMKNKRAEDERVKEYYKKRADLEIQDVAVLGIIESFLESAPQLGLQLFIMQTQGHEENFRRKHNEHRASILMRRILVFCEPKCSYKLPPVFRPGCLVP